MGEVIDGKAFAANLRAAVGRQTAALKAAHGLVPGLAVVLIGEDPASQVYVRHKVQATVEAGMESFRTDLPADTSEAALLEVVARLNADARVHGVRVQMTPPKQTDTEKGMMAVDPRKGE